MNNEIFPLLISGIGIGAVMGLTGAGGGILSVPVLVLLLHIPLQQATPVALTAIALSAGVAAIIGLRRGQLRYRAAGLMAVAGLVFSPLGLWLARQVPAMPLQITFGLVLVLNASRQLRSLSRGVGPSPADAVLADPNQPGPPCRLDPTIGRLVWTNPCARALAGSGAIAGFMAGLLGVGGGFVLIPALRRYTDLDISSIIATSLGVLTLVTGGSALMAASAGQVSTALAIPFAGGAIIGLSAGKLVEPHLPARWLGTSFALLSLLVGLLMIIRAAG